MMASLASEEHADDVLDLAVNATCKYLEENPDVPANDIVEYITNQQMAWALEAYAKVHILVRAAITPNFFKNNEIEKYSPAIVQITNNDPVMERHLIAVVEYLCIDKPKNFYAMIKQLYDEDALEEDIILEWAAEGRSEYTLDAVDEESRNALRGEAEPVVLWLLEADSDDDDEDSDDE